MSLRNSDWSAGAVVTNLDEEERKQSNSTTFSVLYVRKIEIIQEKNVLHLVSARNSKQYSTISV